MNAFIEDNVREDAQKDGITHISTGVAVVKDGAILLVRRVANDYLGGVYELPGGGVDTGESITEGAIRELKEETGLAAKDILATFDGFDYSTDKKPHVRQINFLVTVEHGNITLDPSEHDEYVWISHNQMDTIHMTDNMKQCIISAFNTMDIL